MLLTTKKNKALEIAKSMANKIAAKGQIAVRAAKAAVNKGIRRISIPLALMKRAFSEFVSLPKTGRKAHGRLPGKAPRKIPGPVRGGYPPFLLYGGTLIERKL